MEKNPGEASGIEQAVSYPEQQDQPAITEVRTPRREGGARFVADGEGDPVEVFPDEVQVYSVEFPPDSRDGSVKEPLAERLYRRLDRWRGIEAEAMVMLGLSPEWRKDPPPSGLIWQKSLRHQDQKHMQMVEEIQKELDNGVIVEVDQVEVKVLLKVFLVPKKNGEWRKVLDCTAVNTYCRDVRFKMEDHKLLVQLLRPLMWAVSIDIKSAYHHVRVHPQMAPYLCFEYDERYFQYKGMPFGIKMAPRVFSRVMHRCIVIVRQHWRVEAVQYIDDIWIGHMDREYLERVSHEIVTFLERLGWLISWEKSVLLPRQVFSFLGWSWDSVLMTVALAEEKRMKLLHLVRTWIRWAQTGRVVRLRSLASLIGALSASRLQFRRASLYLAELNLVKTEGVKRWSWNGKVRMTMSVLKDLLWWRSSLEENRVRSLVSPETQAEIWTDASPSGWGAHVKWKGMDAQEEELLAHGSWTNEWSSNKRELVAVHRALIFFSRTEETRHLHHFLLHSDNTTTVYNLNRCASARSLVMPMRRLMSALEGMMLTVKAVHIRGVDNSKADSLSRLSRAGDYSLKMEVYLFLLRSLDVQISCDLFASKTNRKHRQYCTLSLTDSGAMARDAFTIPWNSLTLPLVHPPIPLLLRTLKKIRTEEIRAVVVAPVWLGQPWTNL
jgi:hypothetical protein